jgi:hypothetical protein
MAIVGDAYVVVRAITTSVERDIQNRNFLFLINLKAP